MKTKTLIILGVIFTLLQGCGMVNPKRFDKDTIDAAISKYSKMSPEETEDAVVNGHTALDKFVKAKDPITDEDEAALRLYYLCVSCAEDHQPAFIHFEDVKRLPLSEFRGNTIAEYRSEHGDIRLSEKTSPYTFGHEYGHYKSIRLIRYDFWALPKSVSNYLNNCLVCHAYDRTDHDSIVTETEADYVSFKVAHNHNYKSETEIYKEKYYPITARKFNAPWDYINRRFDINQVSSINKAELQQLDASKNYQALYQACRNINTARYPDNKTYYKYLTNFCCNVLLASEHKSFSHRTNHFMYIACTEEFQVEITRILQKRSFLEALEAFARERELLHSLY